MMKMIIINGLVLGGMYAILAVGFSLVFGVGRILNMAQTAFYMMSAYSIYCGSKFFSFSYPLLAIISIPFVGILGIVFYKLLFDRVKEHELATMIIGIAIAILFQEIFLLVFGGHYLGIKSFSPGFVTIIGVSVTYQQFLVIAVSIGTVLSVFLLLKKTRLGMAVRSVSQDKEIANVMGINVSHISMITFGISASLAAVAGAVISPMFMANPFMWVNPLIITLASVVLGGMGSIGGSVIAALILGFVETAVVFLIPQGAFLRGAVSMFIMIIVLLLRPQGLFGIIFEEELI